jgi:hypothetical protein
MKTSNAMVIVRIQMDRLSVIAQQEPVATHPCPAAALVTPTYLVSHALVKPNYFLTIVVSELL